MQCDDKGPPRHKDEEYRRETLSQLYPFLPYFFPESFYYLYMTPLFSTGLQDAFMNVVPLVEINCM